MKKLLIIGGLCLIGGVCAARVSGTGVTDLGLSAALFRDFAELDLDLAGVFWNILWERGKLFLLMAILLATRYRKLFPAIVAVIGGFGLGYYVGACLMALKLAGVCVILASILPHGICYIAAGSLLYHQKDKRSYIGSDVKRWGKTVAGYLLIILMLLAGVALEAFAGTRLLQLIGEKL